MQSDVPPLTPRFLSMPTRHQLLVSGSGIQGRTTKISRHTFPSGTILPRWPHGHLWLLPLWPHGRLRQAPLTSFAAQARFSAYVRRLPAQFRLRRVTLHGLRSGCAISLALAGVELSSILEHVSWKTPVVAQHYIKLNQFLQHGGVGNVLARLSPNSATMYKQQNALSGFTFAFGAPS